MAIIGVSGKKQSGKDTTGKIIQYFMNTGGVESNENEAPSFENWLKLGFFDPDINYWRIVKFADKVKDIVCLITGCTKEQLENEDFKNSKLNTEWKRWICEAWVYDEEGEAIGKKIISIANNKNDLVLPANYNQFDYNIKEKIPTYRELLQYIGTDLFRDKFHPNTWINALFSDYKVDKAEYHKRFATIGGGLDLGKNVTPGQDIINKKAFEYANKLYPNWIITDVRFPNEAKAIKDKGGIIIRIDRNEYHNKQLQIKARRKPTKSSDYKIAHDILHESETALDNYKFDYVVNNNSDINNLINQIKNILKNEKII